MRGKRHLKLVLMVLISLFALTILVGPKPVSAEEPLVLKIGVWAPEQSGWVKSLAWIYNKIEEKSNGRIKFKWYYSGTLVPVRETISALKSGIADIASTAASLHTGKLPLSNVTTLPMLQKWFYMSAMASRELFLNVPEVRAELAQNNAIYLSQASNTPYGLWTNFPVRSVADLKGRKIMATGMNAELMQALGAVAVTIAPTEVYAALERKTIDGTLGNATYAATYKWNEVCPNYLNYSFGCGLPFMAINKESWNKIPPDIQKMFADLADEAARAGYAIYSAPGDKMLKAGKASGKITVTKLSAEDGAMIKKIAKDTVWQKWIDDMEKKGLPGKKVFDAYSALLDKYEPKDPANE